MKRAEEKLLMWIAALALMLAGGVAAGAQPANGASRVLGTVESVSGNTVTVKTDAGASEKVAVPDTARILRTTPGQKTLAGAAKITVDAITAGDRVLMLVTGEPPTASIVVVNKKSDLEARQQQEEADWQKRGIGGIAKSVDAAAGTLTIASGARTVTIHTTPSTSVRRYAPDSVKFSDAQPSTLAAIQPGDQVTARGDRSADGNEMTAQEIVSGSFRNIAGMVVSTDPSAGTFVVKDLMTKKTVTIRTTPDSDMRKLDPQMAETIALRLKGAGEAPGGGHGVMASGKPAPGEARGPESGGSNGAAGGGGLAKMLQRAPEIHVGELHKGDAVIIVATSGNSDAATAVHLVAGVEPMLRASASGSKNMVSSAWNLGGGSSGGDQSSGEGNP
ncbi:MAG TPA: hypothetical protein VHU89_14270 [Acidobacteriaceae bacterium]|jgi:hypothetical protein|nr:hypothetical protein [Acidobacteriaceae bacterium]